MTFFDKPRPKPKRDEVLIVIKASAYNRLDIWVREGWPGLDLELPHISGSDGAGVVVERGEDITFIRVGQRVAIDPGINHFQDQFTLSGERTLSRGYGGIGEDSSGTCTEFLCVKATNVIAIPDHVTDEVAAAASLTFLTAWRMLVKRGQIRASETVLILGAGGGVNSAAIQIAKLAGCTVYATTSTTEKMQLARDLGADLVLNYKDDPGWATTIYKLTDKVGVDIVIDNVGAATMRDSLRAVRRGGRIVCVGNTSGALVELDLRYIFQKQISLIGSSMGNHDDYMTVMNLIFDGRLRPVISSVLPFEQAPTAMTILEKGDQFGSWCWRTRLTSDWLPHTALVDLGTKMAPAGIVAPSRSWLGRPRLCRCAFEGGVSLAAVMAGSESGQSLLIGGVGTAVVSQYGSRSSDLGLFLSGVRSVGGHRAAGAESRPIHY
ncbi:zinc-binding dehydrogenase [Allomesorhizobium camelthorni]|uniref:Zinc-binding dehydrogenase n=1 Tax=Allomesorhizobium camelthorni TaxID=475069 RepID=A0A6G4WIT7_9HYPH|nr:zinc-binding dehydrogenase [Mesorhizobium camelthorni]NGO54671.1 zinc-binding dehydrogenase [Mesorhizobium camelthorni]